MSQQPPLLLVHGIYMGPWQFGWMVRELASRGYRAQRFGYYSVSGGFDVAAKALAGRLRASPEPPVVVAHSLGGLVALTAMCKHAPELPVRLLCLGTPLTGSAVARWFNSHPLFAHLLGGARQALCNGFDGVVPSHQSIAMIAGDLPRGLGRVLGTVESPSDGTVAIAETRSALLSEHRIVNCSHSGLLFSTEVVDLIARFVDQGRLEPA